MAKSVELTRPIVLIAGPRQWTVHFIASVLQQGLDELLKLGARVVRQDAGGPLAIEVPAGWYSVWPASEDDATKYCVDQLRDAEGRSRAYLHGDVGGLRLALLRRYDVIVENLGEDPWHVNVVDRDRGEECLHSLGTIASKARDSHQLVSEAIERGHQFLDGAKPGWRDLSFGR